MMIERECQTRWMETAETKTIQVVLNGEPRSVPLGLTVDRLLMFLEEWQRNPIDLSALADDAEERPDE